MQNPCPSIIRLLDGEVVLRRNLAKTDCIKFFIFSNQLYSVQFIREVLELPNEKPSSLEGGDSKIPKIPLSYFSLLIPIVFTALNSALGTVVEHCGKKSYTKKVSISYFGENTGVCRFF